jgi:hypothetical protein
LTIPEKASFILDKTFVVVFFLTPSLLRAQATLAEPALKTHNPG